MITMMMKMKSELVGRDDLEKALKALQVGDARDRKQAIEYLKSEAIRVANYMYYKCTSIRDTRRRKLYENSIDMIKMAVACVVLDAEVPGFMRDKECYFPKTPEGIKTWNETVRSLPYSESIKSSLIIGDNADANMKSETKKDTSVIRCDVEFL